MTIPKLTPYTGQVANPDGSQTQTEFTQNMFDQLSYEAQLATELDATIDGMNNAVDEVEASATSAENSANAAEAAASTAGYQGLWPDTGGSALKGEIWQTQVGGTPTGEYYTALQDTTVNPVGDNVNWKIQNDLNTGNLSDYTDIVYKASGGNSAVENMIAGNPVQSSDGNICFADGLMYVRNSGTSGTIADFDLYGFTNGSKLQCVDNLITIEGVDYYVLGDDVNGLVITNIDLTQPYSADIDGSPRNLYKASFGMETFDFRALGPSDGDDVSDAVDIFFTEIHSKRYTKAVMAGRYKISRNFDIDGRYPNQDTTTDIEFAVRFDTTHTDKTREVFSIENTREYSWSGFFQLFCGLPDYSTRRNFRGIKFNLNCSYMSLGSFLVYGTCHDGVWIGNSTQLDWKQLLTRYCGTGNAIPTSVEATIVSATNTGAANTVSQRCVIEVDNYLETLQVGDYVSLINPGTSGYSDGNIVKLVTAVNPGANEITVFPWVTVAQQSLTLRYASGAGLRETGSDSNVHNFGYLDALACGVGFNSSSLYGGMKSSYASQFSTIGYVTARGISDFHQATSMGTSYWEGNGWDIVKPTTVNQSIEILNSTNLDLNKCMALSYYAGTTASPTNENRAFSLLKGISIGIDGNKYSANANPALNATNSLNLHGNSAPTFNIRQAVSPITVNLMEFESISRLFNMNFALMHLSGRGANGQPTSAVTFVPGASYSINGGAPGANFQLSGFTSAALVAVEVDETDTPNNWRITRYQGS